MPPAGDSSPTLRSRTIWGGLTAILSRGLAPPLSAHEVRDVRGRGRDVVTHRREIQRLVRLGPSERSRKSGTASQSLRALEQDWEDRRLWILQGCRQRHELPATLLGVW